MQTTEQRLASLELSRDNWRRGTLLALAVATLTLLSAAARKGGPDFETLTVRELRVVNDKGLLIALLGQTKDGYGALDISDGAEKSGYASISIDDTHSATMRLSNQDRTAAITAVFQESCPYVALLADDKIKLMASASKSTVELDMMTPQADDKDMPGVRLKAHSKGGTLSLEAKNTRHLLIMPTADCRSLGWGCIEDHPPEVKPKEEDKP